MTEGSVTRTKRMGTRFFKNPPQPHMCIQDSLRGSIHPCYINVLSWDKIAMASCPFERLPLYGGMKINPPRTERPEVAVFFVMANPQILQQNGKNATDPKEQSILIELLLDFIEAMNEGVIFMRQYKILNNRDITGELKEIWMAVQSDRAKVQNGTSPEEMKRPVPQYPQYQDQSQDQRDLYQKLKQKKQQQVQQQQYRSLQSQQHQHFIQQMQHSDDDKQLSEPPQYQSNYLMSSRGSAMETPDNYDLSYFRQPQNTIISPNDHIYQPRPVMTSNHCNFNTNKVQDRFLYRDRIVPNVPTNPPTPQQPSVPYSAAPQYQYQQLPRQMGAYNNPNVHPNAGLAFSTLSNPGIPPIINPGLAPDSQLHYEHYYFSIRLPERRVCQKVYRMQQPQQLQLTHAPPVSHFDEFRKRIFRPQANSPPKNLSNKRQVTSSPTHSLGKESVGKSKSPIKVLQRNCFLPDYANPHRMMVDEISGNTFNDEATNEKNYVQVTDLDEDEPRAASDDGKMMKMTEEEIPLKFVTDQVNKKQGKTKIMLLKKNKSFNDIKSNNRNGRVKNGVKLESEQQDNVMDNKKNENKSEDEKSNEISELEQNGYVNEQIESDHEISDGIDIIKKKYLINPSTSEDMIVNNQSNKINGQPNNFGKDKEIFEMYALLRKSEVTIAQDELTNEMAQMSIKDCTDSSEIEAVSS